MNFHETLIYSKFDKYHLKYVKTHSNDYLTTVSNDNLYLIIREHPVLMFGTELKNYITNIKTSIYYSLDFVLPVYEITNINIINI